MNIKILVDSASDISQKEAESLGIYMIPLTISFGSEEYYDGINITPKEFYEKLVESFTLPTTSQVTPARFKEAYKELTNDGSKLIVITLSSKISGTYQSAILAQAGYEDKVKVIDTLNVALGERLLCLHALDLIKTGKSFEEIVNILEQKKTKINIIAMLNTLEYLKKGGRISSAAAFAGGLIGIKPVVSMIDGEVKLIGKAIGSKKANNLLNKMINSRGGIDFSMPCGVFWSGFDDTVMKKYIKDSEALWLGKIDKLPVHPLGCTIGSHVGPGTVGFAFFGKK